MKPRKVTSADFKKIATENEFFLWHFTKPKNPAILIYSYFEEPNTYDGRHYIREIVDTIQIPYFESDIENEIDFLISNLTRASEVAWTPKSGFNPVIIGFNHFLPKFNTWDSCYCTESIVKMIYDLNPKFLENLNLD